jgi:arylsulfatase A-like enzyme
MSYLDKRSFFMRHLLTFIYFSWVYLLSAQPNLVIILTDDQGYKDVGFNGCEDIPTPYIDNIAKMGANCTNGYVTYPVCGPSRAGLLTGVIRIVSGLQLIRQ